MEMQRLKIASEIEKKNTNKVESYSVSYIIKK